MAIRIIVKQTPAPPSGTWESHFDNTEWQVENSPAGSGGLGTWDGAEWDATQFFGFWYGVELGELGTWVEGYRPTKLRITTTGATTNFLVKLWDTDSNEIAAMVTGYNSGDELDITFGLLDIKYLAITNDGSTGFPFSVTNIEFYVP